MEITNNFENVCQLYLSRHEYFEYCFVLVRADIEVLIKRYEYLKGMVESSCSEEYLKRCMEGNGFLTSLIENSTQDNKKLEEKIAALKEVIVQTRKYSERLLEEANKQRKRNDSKEFARRLVECQEEKKTLMSRVAALEQVKIQLNAVASFWHQKGCELSHRYDQHASKIEDIMKDVAVVKQQMARAMELAKEYPAPEKQAESPCKDIGGMFSIAMNVMCQFESSVNTQMRGFQRDIDQIAQANSSLETKCRSLEQELKTVSEEKASLAERLVTKRNVEVELSALQERCECSERQLATTEDSRLTHKRSLATQVELEAKLKAAKAQVKQLQDELQEKRRMMSKKITTIEDGNKLLYKAKQENVTLQQKNAREVETLQERINMLECSAKSTLSDSQATKEELTARQNEIKQLVHALEMRNKVTCHLEEEIVSLNVERDQHLDTITLLKNKIKLLKSGFDKELKSKVEHIGYLQQEVETLEKDRIQLISINDDVAGEIKEWQVMIEHLCLMINEVKDSLTEQTLEKENTTVKDAVTSTKPRLRVLFSSREFQSSVSVFSEIKGIVSEITADAQQSEHLTVLSQTPRMSAVTRTEQFREVCICIGDDSVVTSVTNMVEDIKAQLRAYVHEETKKRNQELVAVFKVQKAESEFKEKCEELDETSLELKVVKNMYISAKQALCELKQQNLCLVNDLNIAEDTITRIDHEMNESSSKITTLEHDVKKGLDTIRKQCDTIKELENTIKDLRKVSNERTVTAKYEPESSRRMQEKVYTQVTMEVLALEVPNKEQSSVEIAQDTADRLSSGSDLLDEGAYRHEQITSELEARIIRMESSHHKEVDNINRVHMENMISLKKAFDRERAKYSKMYEELVGKQQEMHEEQIKELNQSHDSEITFLCGNKRISKEDGTETFATGAKAFLTQDDGSAYPVITKERILLIEENSFDMRIKVLKQEHAKELDSLKIEHARKLADTTEELKNSLAEEEASLEKQLQALREGNEQELLRLKTRYCSEMQLEKENFNLCRREVLESVKKALSVSKTEVMDIEPSTGSGTMAETQCDYSTSHVMSSGAIVLSDFQAYSLWNHVHSGSEVLAVEHLEDLHNMVYPTSCFVPLQRPSSSLSLRSSQRDFSNEKSDQIDEFNFCNGNIESELDNHIIKMAKDFELFKKEVAETERMTFSEMARPR